MTTAGTKRDQRVARGRRGGDQLRTELFEVTEEIDHPPARVWSVLGDAVLLPRYVGALSWVERVGHREHGRGERFKIRLNVGGELITDEVEALVHRPPHHLVLVSRRNQDLYMSIRLDALGKSGCTVDITASLPAGTGSERTVTR